MNDALINPLYEVRDSCTTMMTDDTSNSTTLNTASPLKRAMMTTMTTMMTREIIDHVAISA